METKANYVAVGLFTLLAILAAFGFVYWTAAGSDQGETITLRVRIPGSASGLGRGSAVLFNGVKVGDVRRVFIDVNNPAVAVADAQVDRLTPITQSTEAFVGLAGLTGQANIELKGGSTSEPNIIQKAEQEGKMPEITASPSAVTNLLQTAQTILSRADKVMVQLEGFTTDARQPLTETIDNARKFSEALGNNAAGVETFLSSVSDLSKTLQGASQRLESTLTAAEGLIRSVDQGKVSNIVGNVEQVTAQVRDSTADLRKIMTGVDTAVASFNGIAGDARTALGKVNGVLEKVDPDTVATALTNFQQASGTINTAAGDIAKVTNRIGNRAGDVDQIISDARQLTGRLNQASVRIDGVLQKVDSLLGSDDANGLMADARETLKSFRQVAETLNGRIGPIADGFARFSGQGLRDAEALIQDGRRAINRIEEAVTDLGRNPQRILTGGDGQVREYDGRARR